jgi:hypothetical protein
LLVAVKCEFRLGPFGFPIPDHFFEILCCALLDLVPKTVPVSDLVIYVDRQSE